MYKKGEGVVASKYVAQTPCSKFQVNHPFVYVNMEVSSSWNLLRWEVHQWWTQNWLLSSLMGLIYSSFYYKPCGLKLYKNFKIECILFLGVF